ncbi:hypothetical protein JYU34_011140 [Plutella xylostella]|uniref:3'-5' exonuclease domain-containing protein n=1 Tax=Plutella xylostella TaxID=51655 RepID=A0ABQ7QG58_PLUXY|nr:hypothetical protein JYU34_011140 [Plutella xylostella]
MNDKNALLKIGGSVIALGFAGATYLAIRRYRKKYTLRDAVNAFNYLQIKTITTETECDQVVHDLRRRCSKHKAIGFDCEWVTEGGKKRPVALMQLSSIDGLCGLFRLPHLKGIPPSLRELLEDENIYKVGVAPIDDAAFLFQDYSVNLKSSLDLRHIAQLCGYDPGGLASLAKQLLAVTLDKSWRIRCSDWEAETLTERQVKYAAADAHVAIKIFGLLAEEFENRGLFSWFKKRSSDRNSLDEVCLMYRNTHFKPPKKESNSKKKEGKGGKGDKDEALPGKRYPHATRSKPLYTNCFLRDPDGDLLCTCDKKKALWYVEKQLADIIQDEPLIVQLRFEPAGRSVGDVGRYYTLQKENRCVVCGSSDSYIRKNVVPREYRKYFPEVMKDHSSHDVVLLCAGCHQRSNMLDRGVRARLAAECGAPLAPAGGSAKFIEDNAAKKVKSAARALLHQSKRHVLPPARVKELEGIILENYPQSDEITQELLEEAANIQVVYENEDYESHGNKVVEHYSRHEGLLRLEELWRRHFLASMRPRHLPPLWSLTHNEERLRIRYNEGRLNEEDKKLLGLTME